MDREIGRENIKSEEIVNQVQPNTNRRGNPKWQKGMKSPNPQGQAVGFKSKALRVKAELMECWDKLGGIDAFIKFAKKYPKDAYKILTGVLPKDLDIQGEGIASTHIVLIHPDNKKDKLADRDTSKALSV